MNAFVHERLFLTIRSFMSATSSQVLPSHPHDFEGVISRYSPVLYQVALRRLRNVQDAEDAVQDALLSAHEHIGQFEGRSQLSTWLTTIVTNVALMKLRRSSRHEMLSLDQDHENDGAAPVPQIKDARPTPETICAQAEMDERLRSAVAHLSPKLRVAIQLCDLEDRSTREAANILGISRNALKSRVSRARAALALLLSKGVADHPVVRRVPVTERKAAVRPRV
jgi:RNA polymerase sigma-70 factor, ECF subfamily